MHRTSRFRRGAWGDVCGDIHPDPREHGQTPQCIAPISCAGPGTEVPATTAAERFTVGGPESDFAAVGRLCHAGSAAGRVDVRLVRRGDHRQGDGSNPEVVFAGLPAASLGAVPGGHIGPVRRPDSRETSGGTDTGRSQAPGLASVTRRPRTPTRRRPHLQPRSALPLRCAQRRPRCLHAA
jgi:hypothetical protein